MQRTLSWICIMVVLFAPGAFAMTRQVFTRTSGPTCHDGSSDIKGVWTCPGPSDYLAVFSDEGNLAGVAFGRIGRPFDPLKSGSVWRGAGKVFGEVVEWRIDAAGMPVAAVIRIWEARGDDTPVQTLRVFAIDDDAACLYAIVATNAPHANQKAASIAETASLWTCAETAKSLEEAR